jgi:hypothetical protein
MGKYRKKPVVIEAIQLTKNNFFDCIDFIKEHFAFGHLVVNNCEKAIRVITVSPGYRETLLELGDYIVCEHKGADLKCYKPDALENIYEPLED